jgi:hypothetical protein
MEGEVTSTQSTQSAPVQQQAPASQQQVAPQQNMSQGQAQAQNSAPAMPGWMAGLPKELQGHEAFKGMAKVGDLGHKYLELMTRSQRALYLPTDNSTPEERASFLRSLGHPETPEAYTVPKAPDGLQVNKQAIAALQQQAHELGWTNKQFQAYVNANYQRMQQAQQAKQQATAKALSDADKSLRDEWKAEYDRNRELALRAFQGHVDEATAKQLSESGLINQPWFIKLMHRIGTATGEGSFIRGAATGGAQKPNYMTDYNKTKV